MSLAPVLSRRFKSTGLVDPDSLHGLLMLDEVGKLDAQALRYPDAACLLARAREGRAGRVPPAHMSVSGDDKSPPLPGLFSRLWMRQVIAMMLRPDGATTFQITDTLTELGFIRSTADAVSQLRADLRMLGVSIEATPLTGHAQRYQITGRDAWRMRKIIANGWAL
jgi:hypothetical protein